MSFNSICKNKDCLKCNVKCPKNKRWFVVPIVSLGGSTYECPGCGYIHSLNIESGIMRLLHKCPNCGKELFYTGEEKETNVS